MCSCTRLGLVRCSVSRPLIAIGIMLPPCEQQRNKLDGTDCVGPKSSSNHPSSNRPEPYAGVISKRSPRASDESNRQQHQKPPTSTENRDRSPPRPLPARRLTGRRVNPRKSGAPHEIIICCLAFASREIKARGNGARAKRGTSHGAPAPANGSAARQQPSRAEERGS